MSVRKNFVFAVAAGFLALLSGATQPVFAASNACTGATCSTTGTSVNLNVEVVIPNLVRLRIGDPSLTNTLVFDMTSVPQDVGNAVAQTGSGGDLGGSTVSVRVLANGGATSVQLDAGTSGSNSGIDCQASSGSCQNGTDFLNWDEIAVTGNGCNAPILDNAGSGSETYTATGGIVNVSCDWTYEYRNNGVPVYGTYSGTVTYTATRSP